MLYHHKIGVTNFTQKICKFNNSEIMCVEIYKTPYHNSNRTVLILSVTELEKLAILMQKKLTFTKKN